MEKTPLNCSEFPIFDVSAPSSPRFRLFFHVSKLLEYKFRAATRGSLEILGNHFFKRILKFQVFVWQDKSLSDYKGGSENQIWSNIFCHLESCSF